MRIRTFFAFFPILSGMLLKEIRLPQGFDKAAFYAVMASGKLKEINSELAIVAAAATPEKEAYEGALLMRKAGLLAKPAEKLKSFKAGCIKLESALLKDSTNVEYHFLRLTIQEHAPRTVKYYKDLKKDRQHILYSFKKLSPEVQKAVIDYSKNSKILRPGDFDPKNL